MEYNMKKINMIKILIYSISILSSIVPTSGVRFLNGPPYIVAKVGEELILKYSISETRPILLQSISNGLRVNIYKTGNFAENYKNKWQVTTNDQSTEFVFIINSTEKTDAMEIEATVTNGIHTDTHLSSIALYDSGPRIEYNPINAVMEGETISFTCEFNLWGSVTLNYAWYINDKLVPGLSDDYIKNSRLVTLHKVVVATAEMNNQQAFCLLSLYSGELKKFIKFQSSSVWLSVEYKPRDIQINKTDLYGPDIKLQCVAKGNPTPKYIWHDITNPSVINNASTIISVNSNLTIEERLPYRVIFECTAWNIINEQKKTVTKKYTFQGLVMTTLVDVSGAKKMDVPFNYFILIILITIYFQY